MFDAVRSNKRIVQVILALIAITFAFFGIESYLQFLGKDDYVAKVGRSKITAQELDQALREEQDRLRSQLGEAFDPSIMQRPELKRSVVDGLVNQRLLRLQLDSSGMRATPESLRQMIAGIPAFQEEGKFSQKRYEQMLAARGYSPDRFEAGLAQDLAQQQLIAGVGRSAIVPAAVVDRWLTLQDETREVSMWSLSAATYLPQVKLAADAAQKDYDANKARYETPEQVKVEYLVLSQDELGAQVSVSDDEIRKQYDADPKRYAAPEERRARHILIEAAKDAGADKRAAAKAKAEALHKQVVAKPDSFAVLAKANSQDPGSAANGGDLGFFARGAMVKPFEDAAFGLKVGQISAVVETDYGYHIIQLEEVRGGGVKSFDQVKGEIAVELKQSAAAKRYAEVADSFGNTVYEQPDSLKPAAEKYKLVLRQSDWIAKGGRGLPAPFNNEKVMAAVFSADSVKNSRNTEAIDLGNNSMVSLRVLEHKAAAIRPFAEVRAAIEQKLTVDEAIKLAAKDGEAQIAKLRKGEAVEAKFGQTGEVSRAKPGPLPLDALKAVFRTPVDKLPAFAGIEVPGQGYAVFKISKVTKPALAPNDPRRADLASQYGRLLAEEDLRAYVAALRDRYPVKLSKSAGDAKE
ncbi:SurA N-terminal domain-containing protein [Niveibacterium sp. 24ML]|uniref:SurA N-terminal domain-containing protein n=1 Tax=Niveibacterium sp. 24ML TaxID=2985512 RepID=UPI002270134B|nr:SurA N-terminal domain-containing protein [Niveibacterium sp. 24ML]MCX9156437.1 SurA N-terminal domain-containing protein [Niveibacterium sp. 24ML]